MISFAPYRTVARLLVLPILAGAAMLAVAGSCLAQARTAEDLIVNYDQSQLVKLSRPAAEIIIGNPSIADVSVQNGSLLVVTGKTFGITNMIILDAQRNVILDQRILVKRDEAKVVNLKARHAAPVLQLHAAVQPIDRDRRRGCLLRQRGQGLREEDGLLRAVGRISGPQAAGSVEGDTVLFCWHGRMR